MEKVEEAAIGHGTRAWLAGCFGRCSHHLVIALFASVVTEISVSAGDDVKHEVFYSYLSEIWHADITSPGGQIALVYSGGAGKYVRGLTSVEEYGGRLHWNEWNGQSSSIMSSGLDGSCPRVELAGQPNAFAQKLDTTGRHLYWVDLQDQVIRRADLRCDGTIEKASISNVLAFSGPPIHRDLAISSPSQKIYWTSADCLMAANFDGSAPGVLYKDTASFDFSSPVLDGRGWIYWVRRITQGGTRDIVRARASDGSRFEVLLGDVVGLFEDSLTIDQKAGKLYFGVSPLVSGSNPGVHQMELDGSRLMVVPSATASSLAGITSNKRSRPRLVHTLFVIPTQGRGVVATRGLMDPSR